VNSRSGIMGGTIGQDRGFAELDQCSKRPLGGPSKPNCGARDGGRIEKLRRWGRPLIIARRVFCVGSRKNVAMTSSH